MTSIYDSITKDAADSSPIDYSNIDFKKQGPLKSPQPNRELSGGQSTVKPTNTRISFSIYDSVNL